MLLFRYGAAGVAACNKLEFDWWDGWFFLRDFLDEVLFGTSILLAARPSSEFSASSPGYVSSPASREVNCDWSKLRDCASFYFACFCFSIKDH